MPTRPYTIERRYRGLTGLLEWHIVDARTGRSLGKHSTRREARIRLEDMIRRIHPEKEEPMARRSDGTSLSVANVEGGQPVERVEVRGLTWIDGDYRPDMAAEECSWQEWLEANAEGLGDGEAVDLHRDLSLHGSAVVGGGATAAFTITRIDGAEWVPPSGWAPVETGGGCTGYVKRFTINAVRFEYLMTTPDGYRPLRATSPANVRLYFADAGRLTVILRDGSFLSTLTPAHEAGDDASEYDLSGRAERLALLPPLSPDLFEAVSFAFGKGVV